MAKQRFIDTKFWDDTFIRDLPPEARYLYLYLLTNPLTNCCGVYEISIDRIAFDTGIKKDSVLKHFSSFGNGRVTLSKGWVILRNYEKYHCTNPNMKIAAKNEREKLPDEIRLLLDQNETLTKPYGNPSEPYGNVPPSNSNSNSNSNLVNKGEKISPAQTMRDFIQMVEEKNERYSLFVLSLADRRGLTSEIVRAELDKFVEYWCELNKNGTKQRWELQNTFEVQRRLKTWLERTSTQQQFTKGVNKDKPLNIIF